MPKINFFQKVYEVVSQIPYGKVMSYGQVAVLCDSPRASRAVGWALRALSVDTHIPWHRVVNSKGFLTISNQYFGADEQKKRLELEKIRVNRVDGLWQVDLSNYLADISQI